MLLNGTIAVNELFKHILIEHAIDGSFVLERTKRILFYFYWLFLSFILFFSLPTTMYANEKSFSNENYTIFHTLLRETLSITREGSIYQNLVELNTIFS